MSIIQATGHLEDYYQTNPEAKNVELILLKNQYFLL